MPSDSHVINLPLGAREIALLFSERTDVHKHTTDLCACFAEGAVLFRIGPEAAPDVNLRAAAGVETALEAAPAESAGDILLLPRPRPEALEQLLRGL